MITPTISGRRLASIGSALAVAGIAAIASYSHMRHLAIQYGQDRLIATLLPMSVDGMLVVATVALGDGRRYRWSAWLAFWVGVVASVIANVLAAQPSAIARCISAWPAIAFLLVVEVITRGGRIRPRESAPIAAEEPPAVPIQGPVEPTVADTPDEASPSLPASAVKIARLRQRTPALKQEEVARKARVSLSTVKRHWTVTEPSPTDQVPVNGRVPELTTT